MPRPMRGADNLDFSFSGLKTALRRAAEERAPLTDSDVANLCASFQRSVGDVVVDRLARAMERFALDAGSASTIVVAGGVAANRYLRERMENAAAERGFTFVAPPPHLCTDNAVMIAHAGAMRLAAGMGAFEPTPRPRWPLDETCAPVVGTGKRGAKV